MQLVLFGFAINSDPRHLPAAVLLADHGPHGRTLLHAMRNSGYFDFVRAGAHRGGGARRCSRAARCSSSSTSRENFTPRPAARRPARRCWSRPTPPIPPRPATPSARCARSLDTALAQRPQGPARVPRRHARPGRAARPRPLQPRSDHAVQHRARPDGRGAHHDDGHDHRPGHHARARARHDGKSALHAHAAVRGADRQDRAVHPRRLHPGGADPARRALPFRRADGRQPRPAARRSRSSSSPRTSRWASPSPPWPRTSSRRCR